MSWDIGALQLVKPGEPRWDPQCVIDHLNPSFFELRPGKATRNAVGANAEPLSNRTIS